MRAELDDEAELYDEAEHRRADLDSAGPHAFEAPRANERPRADRCALSHTVEHLRGIKDMEKGTETEQHSQAQFAPGTPESPRWRTGTPRRWDSSAAARAHTGRDERGCSWTLTSKEYASMLSVVQESSSDA